MKICDSKELILDAWRASTLFCSRSICGSFGAHATFPKTQSICQNAVPATVVILFQPNVFYFFPCNSTHKRYILEFLKFKIERKFLIKLHFSIVVCENESMSEMANRRFLETRVNRRRTDASVTTGFLLMLQSIKAEIKTEQIRLHEY